MAGRNGSPGDQHVQQYPPGEQPAYRGQPGYAQQTGYPQQPGRPQQAGRPPQGGYPPQPGPQQQPLSPRQPGYGATLLGPPQPGGLQPGGPPPGGRPPAGPSGRGGGGGGEGRGGGGRRRLIDYPRFGKTGVLRWIPSWKFAGTTVLSLVVLMIVALMAAYAATPIPPPRPITEAQTTTVYYSDGKTVLTKFSQQEGNRTIVPLSKVPAHLQWAVIAAEDKTFYANKGVSPVGILRAAYNNARGRQLQGGSTITQQYVKNSRVENTRTITRKAKEFFIAIKLNNSKKKEDILLDYLNTIFWGRDAQGIQAAAQAYYNKDVSKLTLAESAYLAGIIQGPNLFDTDDGPEATARAKERFDYVLNTMLELGQITPEERAKTVFVKPIRQKERVAAEDDQTIYLTELVKKELAKNGMKMEDVSRAGYRIKTTFDKKLIDEAIKSVHDKDIGMGPRKTWPKGTEVGLVSLDPNSGAVRAIYGGNGKRWNSAATQDKPQGGSTFKPFTLLAALEGESKNGSDGISLRSRFPGKGTYTYKSSTDVSSGSREVSNFDGEKFGMIDLITATEHSVNTVYAQLNEEIGDGTGKRTQDAAIRAGLPKDAIGPEVSNTLGNGTPTVLQMASAYGTIAAGGIHNPPYVIENILSPEGGTVFKHPSKPEKAFSSGVVADATFAMQKVITSGTGEYAKRLGRPAAGKTGTVGTTGRATKAAWFVGFTPQLSTAVAIHSVGPDGISAQVVKGWGPFKKKDMQGGMFPVRIWTEFMKRALEGKPEMDFPEPAWVGVEENAAPEEPVAPPSPTATDGQGTGDQTASPTEGQGDGQNTDGQGNGDGQNKPSPTGQNNDGQNGDGQTDGQNNGGQNNGGQNDGGQNNGGQNDGGQPPPGATP